MMVPQWLRAFREWVIEVISRKRPVAKSFAATVARLPRALNATLSSMPALSSLLRSAADTPVHQSIHRHLIAGAVLFGGVSFGVGGWAATTRLAGAIITSGFLVVETSAKKVQHPTGGVVSKIEIREGDHVEENQVLLRLDATQTLSQLMMVSKSLDELQARQARLEAERNNEVEMIIPAELLARAGPMYPDAARAVNGERNLFELRRAARAGQKSQLKQRIAQLEDEIKGLIGQTESKKQETDFINRELQGLNDLWRKNLVPISKVTALERDRARLEGETRQLNGTIAQQRGKIAETELQILQVDEDLRSEVAKDLSDVRSKIVELTEKRVAVEDQFRRIDLKAPQSGTVHQLKVHTIGGVIAPGDTILEIVPDRDSLRAEVKVAPQDIDKVRPGQAAVLHFSAFNARTTPEIKGEVSLVSADINQDQRTGMSYYVARLTPDPKDLERLGGLKLIPGMPVEAFIQTGERTVLSYLMKPLHDQLSRAFKEK
jgi:HlyD family secretion protein